MIVAEQKPIKEILEMLPEMDNLLVVGCDTCVTVCLAGGEKEVKVLSAAIRMSDNKIHNVIEASIERQCDQEFIEEIVAEVNKSDVVLSMACGAGVQKMSDYFSGKIILPALNTLFMGSNEAAGYWLERCLGCGNCKLGDFGGVCPVARCSKSLLNGPCGGSQDGKCEVDPEKLDCGWQLIFDRMKELGLLYKLEENQPIKDWSTGRDGGPRKVVREDVQL